MPAPTRNPPNVDDKMRSASLHRGLSSQIVVGLLGGIGCGLFFGELCGPLAIVGEAFVNLLRLTVLPYIAVALVASVGKLSLTQSRSLAVTGGLVVLLLWATVVVAVVVIPLGFPEWKAEAFFSTSTTELAPQQDLLSMFVPPNIFAAFVENKVPAIVLVCISMGLALSTIAEADRRRMIDTLDVLADLLVRVSVFVTRLAPIGIFAIAAHTLGTMSFEELLRLKAYLIAYTIASVMLTFVVMPLMVCLFTPWRYRDVMTIARDPMLTAFATGKLIIVLPLLIQRTRELFETSGIAQNSEAAPPGVLYPLAYSFPPAGKLIGILFIPFAAWFTGRAMTLDQYPGLFAVGIPAYFGGPIVATPWLLDYAHLPHDMFQLFMLAGVLTGRLGDALGVMHLVVFSLLTASLMARQLKVTPVQVGKAVLVIGVTAVLMLFGMRTLLKNTLVNQESRSSVLARLQLIDDPVSCTIVPKAEPNPEPLLQGESLLERIRRRGVIRDGYNEDKLPFAFFNQTGGLVGYDVNMAHVLASDLGVKIEFVRFERATLVEQLNADHFDVVMSGLVGSLERSEAMLHTDPYMDVTLGLVVPDYRVREFRTLELINRMSSLRIAFADLSRGFANQLRARIPDAELVEIDDNRDFFAQPTSGEFDALLISAESGFAFTLRYPDFEVVVPKMSKVSLPLFYAIANRDAEMRDFLHHWIRLRKDDGTTQSFYDHWILGRSSSVRERRWCIIRDVLEWID